jgi:hypothetical protein
MDSDWKSCKIIQARHSSCFVLFCVAAEIITTSP